MILWMIQLGIFFVALGFGLIIWGKITNRKPEAKE